MRGAPPPPPGCGPQSRPAPGRRCGRGARGRPGSPRRAPAGRPAPRPAAPPTPRTARSAPPAPRRPPPRPPRAPPRRTPWLPTPGPQPLAAELPQARPQKEDAFHRHLSRGDCGSVAAGLASSSGRPPLGAFAPAPALCAGGRAACDGGAAPPAAGRPRGTYAVKARLLGRWDELDPGATAAGALFSDPLAQLAYDALHGYRDVFLAPRHPPPKLAPGAVGDAYLLHCLNHALKTRDLIGKGAERESEAIRTKNAAFEPSRDQGFTRPKVLLLLPTRNSAWRTVQRLLEMCPASQTVEVANRERLDRGFAPDGDSSDEGEDPLFEGLDSDEAARAASGSSGAEEAPCAASDSSSQIAASAQRAASDQAKRALAALRKQRRRQLARRKAKPADFRALFSGNCDDDFCVGIKLTRRSVRLFTGLHGADIIVASPLGLVRRIERGSTPANLKKGPTGKGRQQQQKKTLEQDELDLIDAPGTSDYLSSIEICVVDHAHMLALQNWAHVSAVVERLSAMPTRQRGADLRRTREAYLAGLGRHLRQTIVLAEWETPAMRALVERRCASAAGRARLWAHTPREASAAQLGPPRCRQQFERLAAADAASAPDALFARFERALWPALAAAPRGGGGDGTLVLCASYYDFARLRHFFQTADAQALAEAEQCEVAFISEYTSDSDTAKAKAAFASGRAGVLVLTERAHFYRRHVLRGASAALFYGLPHAPRTYTEVLAMLTPATAAGGHASTHALYTRFDALTLRRVVGDQRARRMLDSDSRASVIET